MEHSLHVIVLGSALAAIVVGLFLASSFQVVAEPGGYFRIAQRTEPTSADACFDTDGGANWFVRGSVRYLDWSFVDDCTTIVGEENVSILYEGYCASPSQPVIVQHYCARACENGACVQ